MGTADSCSTEEFINGDEGLAICVELDDATWEADFMDNLGSVQDAAEEGESDNEDLTPPPPKIKSFQEAMSTLEDVKYFFESSDCSIWPALQVH